MEFFETIKLVKSNWKPYKQWVFEQKQKEQQKEKLHSAYPPTQSELSYARQYGRTIVDIINTMDQHSIDKSEDAGVAAGYALLPLSLGSVFVGGFLGSYLGRIVEKSKYASKLANYRPYWMPFGIIVTSAIVSPIMHIWLANITKQASRIARFQTRENDLKNYENFIVYDDNQIREAQEIAKTLPEVEEKRQDKFTKELYNPIKAYKRTKQTANELKKDDLNYQQWKKTYLKKEELDKTAFQILKPPKEVLIKAEKDRDILLGTIKKIENSALEYYNNMVMAACMVNAVVVGASGLLGFGIISLINFAQKKNIKLQKNNFVNATKGLPIFLSVFAPVFMLAPLNKLIKDAARVGRFKAKQELLKEPKNFIEYDKNQKNSVGIQDCPSTKEKNFLKRFKDDIKILKQFKKEWLEYSNYMETEHKEELKLQEALKQINVTQQQRKEAFILQKQAFHSFEKIDEKAQRYTDDTDAAVDSARAILSSVIAFIFRIIPVYFCAEDIKIANGNKVPENIFKVIGLTFSGKLKGKTLAIMLLPLFIPKIIHALMVIKGVQIKKDAGKIGVMNAMQDLENPSSIASYIRN